jgi:hypothetical protein
MTRFTTEPGGQLRCKLNASNISAISTQDISYIGGKLRVQLTLVNNGFVELWFYAKLWRLRDADA